MTTTFPFRGTSAVALLFVAFSALPAAADPIVIPIRITGGTVTVERDPIIFQPSASAGLAGTGGFVLSGFGVSVTPGGCDPCFSGDPTGLPESVFLHEGSVTFGRSSGEFDLSGGGSGELDFTAPGFNAPISSSGPVVFTTPFTMNGSVSLADSLFSLSGSGTASATFFPRDTFPGLGQELVFDNAVFHFAGVSPTPEPATIFLFAAGLIAVRARRWRPGRHE